MATKISKEQVTDNLVESIKKSGKQFKDIPISAVEAFLKEYKVDQSQYKEIYEKVSKIFNPSKKVVTSTKDVVTNPDLKERTPRKKIFGDIVKI